MRPGQRAARKLDLAQRRARVVAYFAEHPNATQRDAARDLGIARTTVQRDIDAAIAETIGRAAEVYVAAMIQRNEAIVGAFMPLVLRRGSAHHATLVLAADKRTAEMLGLDAPKKVEETLNLNVRKIAEDVAAEFGRSVDEVLAEAEQILRESRV